MKKLEYGGTPRSIIDINKKFIKDFYTYGVSDGSISQKDLEEWIKKVEEAHNNHPNEPMKAFAEYRKAFAALHYPHLILNDLSDVEFFKALKKDAKAIKEATENADKE